MRRLYALLLLAAIAPAQDKEKEKDDSGITVDETPTGPDREPAKTTPQPARAPGKKPTTVTIQKKVYSIALPADWVLQEADDPKTEIGWDVLLPGSRNRASLYLVREENMVDPRSAPRHHAEWLKKEKADVMCEVRMKGCPRIVVQRSLNDTVWVDAYFYLKVRNNPYVLQLSCSEADFPQAEADTLAAAASFSAKVELWPAIPKGYEISQEGTWLVARAPSVTASLAPLVRVLKEQEKRFKRDHGALPKSDAPIVVLVHASQDEGAKIEPKVTEWEGFYPDIAHRRMFVMPVAKDNLEQESSAAATAQGCLFVAKYGDWAPEWVFVGERTLARAEAMTGKPLPALDEGFANWASKLNLHTLDKFEELYKSDKDAWQAEAFFYVGMFHAGKHRKAYDAFLADYAENADGEGALARHILPVGMDQLRDATHDFVFQKIKPEKREQKK